MAGLRERSLTEFVANPFQKISRQWMLVAAAKPDGSVNAMTASWGGVGELWNEPVAFIFIRPQRFTKEFIDASQTVSLSFLPEAYRSQLSYMGSVSGRDEDKIAHSGLTVVRDDAPDTAGTPYFAEADDVLICRKLYAQVLDPSCFIDTDALKRWYPDSDFHTVYVAGIRRFLTTSR